WGARYTKVASPSPRRSSAPPTDGRPRAAARDRHGRRGAAVVEPRDGAPRPGGRTAPRAARRVAQHERPRRALAGGTRTRARAGEGGGKGGRGRQLAFRVARARL